MQAPVFFKKIIDSPPSFYFTFYITNNSSFFSFRLFISLFPSKVSNFGENLQRMN